jgi:hypothetical protein
MTFPYISRAKIFARKSLVKIFRCDEQTSSCCVHCRVYFCWHLVCLMRIIVWHNKVIDANDCGCVVQLLSYRIIKQHALNVF